MKYDWKFKLDCVQKYKKGWRDFAVQGPSRHSFLNLVRSWVEAYDDLGIDGLKRPSSNKRWTQEERFGLVAKVLAGNPISGVARSARMNAGQLWQWVRRYREKGMDGLECPRKGRPPEGGPEAGAMRKKEAKLTPEEREELKLLRERNEYLEAENLYLKKLRALASARAARPAKARKRKPSKPSGGKPDAG